MPFTLIPLNPGGTPLLERATLDNLNWNGRRFSREDLARPEFSHYTCLNAERGDFGFVAALNGAQIDVVWLLHRPSTNAAYGYVEDATPELSIWTAPKHRGRGVGRVLLQRAMSEARRRGVVRISLSVEQGNPARDLYVSEGFVDVPGQDAGVMVCELGPTPTVKA